MSLPGYPAYKRTGSNRLGSIPATWKVKRVKHIALFAYGDALPSEERDESGAITVVGSNGAIGRHGLSNATGPCIVIGRKGSYGEIRWNDTSVFVIDTAYFIDFAAANLRWLYWALLTADLAAVSQDTGVPGLSREVAHNTLLPVPPSAEQPIIAAFLDRETTKLDALVSEQKGLLSLLLEKRKAAITSVVARGLNHDAQTVESGLGWLGEIPAHWKLARIGYYASVENGSTPSKENLDYWDSGDVAWVASGEVNQYVVTEPTDHVSKQAVAECGLRVLPKGAVLVGLIGQGRTRAMSAILGIPAAINQNVAAVTAKEGLLPSYLHYCLQAAYEFMRECARGGNQAALNCELLAAFRIPIPPLEEQEGIVRHLDRLHASTARLMAECEGSIALLQEHRAAVISAAVTGKMDVRGFAAAGTPERAAA